MSLLYRVCLGLATTLLTMASLCAELAQKGSGDWLIFTGVGGTLPDYLHSNTLSESQLAYLASELAKIDADFRQQGATFLWVIPPNTPTIYPESMPARYKPIGPTSKLEQMNAAFAAKGLASFVDLTAVLIDEKNRSISPLYRKTDTHWNDIGAFVAYREIMHRMAKRRPELKRKLEPMNINAYVLTTQKGYSGDLATMMGLQGDLTEDLPVLTAKSVRTAAIAENILQVLQGVKSTTPIPPPVVTIETKRPGVVAVNNSARCPGPSLMIYHDSYGIYIAQWMVEHFCNSTFYYSSTHTKTASLDREMLAQTNPSFVVLESVERLVSEPFLTTILDGLFAMESAVGRPTAKR